MKSDTDCLNNVINSPVLLDLSDWRTSLNNNLLVLMDESSPPQHCNLQVVRLDCPLPVTLDITKKILNHEVDLEGRLLIKNTINDLHLQGLKKKGPAICLMENVELVYAYYCARQPNQCQFLFNRPRPGHWPKADILEQAKHTGTFLVPQGHAESDNRNLEWRFSTPFIERLLMFNLSLIKVKVYTFLKILRKTYFKPVVGDRFSTFHFKTALLFTIESYPSGLWLEYNLLQCVIFCLTTLKRWCRLNYCPHFTISGVNLFVGKLRQFELTQISAMLSDMIQNIMVYVVNIKMDGVGRRMLNLIVGSSTREQISTRYENILSTVHICLGYLICQVNWDLYNIWNQSDSSPLESILQTTTVFFNYCLMQNDLSKFIKDSLKSILLIMNTHLATTQASACVEFHHPISAEIYNLYKSSLNSDLTSSRLKFASMLYCTDQYEEAAAVLKHTEALLHPDVWQFSTSGRNKHEPSNNFLRRALNQSVSECFTTSVALGVLFYPQEVHCVPKHLVYEMHRTINKEDIQQRHPLLHRWMDRVMVDSIPYLYYLQYLIYRQLGQQKQKCSSMLKLEKYVYQDSKGCGQIETAANMLGHCLEMENRLDLAWKLYFRSLKAFPHNNAAKWHIMILLYKAQVQSSSRKTK